MSLACFAMKRKKPCLHISEQTLETPLESWIPRWCVTLLLNMYLLLLKFEIFLCKIRGGKKG